MTTKSVFLTILFSAIALAISGALVILALSPEPYVPSGETLNADMVDDSIDLSSMPNLVGGSVVQSDVQTTQGAYYCTITATADNGYTFGYWQNGTTKLCGDVSITLSSSTVDGLNNLVRACTPIFVANANVEEIADMTDFTGILIRDINNNTTEGKLYKLTADIADYSTVGNITLPLGTFRGILDGNNHSIGNIYINGAGMFEALDGAVVKDIILNGSINSSNPYSGGLCGSINNSLLSRCLSHLYVGNTANNGCAGGLVGVCSYSSARSMMFSCGFYGTIRAKTADQMIGSNANFDATGVKTCAIFKPKYNGAIYEN